MHSVRRLTLLVIFAAAIFFAFPMIQSTEASPVPYTGSCHAAVDTYWPAQSRSWAHYVVNRESRGISTAANKRSSARGCFQLLIRLHGRRFTAVGCNPQQWADARCNVLAALNLYQQAGKAPWRL